MDDHQVHPNFQHDLFGQSTHLPIQSPDLHDSPMNDAVTPHTGLPSSIPTVAGVPSAMDASFQQNDSGCPPIDDSQVYEYLSSSDRAAHLDSLTEFLRSSMNELKEFGGTDILELDGQSQGQYYEAWLRTRSASASGSATLGQPQPQAPPHQLSQSQLPPVTSTTSTEITMAGPESGGSMTGMNWPPIEFDQQALSREGEYCALAETLYEVPLGPDGVFNGDSFVASGVDVEMLERDMNPTVSFMWSRP